MSKKAKVGKLSQVLSRRKSQATKVEFTPRRSNSPKLQWLADFEFEAYLRTSAAAHKDLQAFRDARKFFRTPSPCRPKSVRNSPGGALLATKVVVSDSRTDRRLATAWRTHEGFQPDLASSGRSLTSSRHKFRNLDALITEATDSSSLEKRHVSSSLSKGKLKFNKLRQLLKLAEDEDCQFAE
jgi:hypothetical protein